MLATERLNRRQILAQVLGGKLSILLVDAAFGLVDVTVVSMDFAGVAEPLLARRCQICQFRPEIVDFLYVNA